MPEPLSTTDPRGGALLGIARRSLETKLRDPLSGYDGSDGARWLAEPAATYVTLWSDGKIRGCLGSPVPLRPLGLDVWVTARTAAFQDLRFPPLTEEELPAVSLEVSLLSPLERLGWRDPGELLAMLRPGVDGMVLQNDLSRGVFLPFMWSEFPTPPLFLAGLKAKARLPEDFWGPEVRLWRFTVESFRD